MTKVFNSSELSQMIELQINKMVSTWSGNDLKWTDIYQNKGDLIMNWYTCNVTRFGTICTIWQPQKTLMVACYF